MGMAARAALPRTLLSRALRTEHAFAVGISFFLLVPIRLGDPRLSHPGFRLFQAERSEELKRKVVAGSFCDAAPPPLGEELRQLAAASRPDVSGVVGVADW